MLAFFSTDGRRENRKLRSFLPGKNRVDDLIDALLVDFAAAIRAMRLANARVKQAIIIVDFRHRAHGGTRIVVRGFLFD